CLQYDNLWTF
nr:immunoglobulin light chain junction region [Mus musculus]NSL99234.1 immunoglobulin light chain junction region [Mus musculus]NSL99686.1 immunoglobulin light chain junction region [Mus musculus]NSM00375.1 immunoglobulin light chain junction region [Mus musculus]NSM02254.1 immunoglobulin light chain junction region [Mus musculus]